MLQEENPQQSRFIEEWINNPNRLLTTMLIGINVLNITSAIIAETLISHFVKEWQLPAWSGTAFSIGFVSLFVLIFCEFIPKIVAYHNAPSYTVKLIRMLLIADRIVSPLGNFLLWIGNTIIKMFGGKSGMPQGAFVTEAEIMQMVDRGERQGVLEKDESDMIRSIFEFSETQVKEVMVPRPDMLCASADTTVIEIARYIDEVNHSRIPVYEGNEDNIIGIINSNAILQALREGRDNENIRPLLHEAYFIPESKKVDQLLHEFQSMRAHISIVIDEYGSTAGLVTLEDLLEEIVGEIRDEYDTEEPLYRWVSADTARVNARIDVTELNDVLDIKLPDEEGYESLGGLVMSQTGRLPRQGDSLIIDNKELTVERMAGRRIKSVLIRLLPEPEKQEENGEAATDNGASGANGNNGRRKNGGEPGAGSKNGHG